MKKKISRFGKNLFYGMITVIVLMLLTSCTNTQTDDNTNNVVTLDSRTSQSTTSIIPIELRCEYLNNPLGIDAKQPRLSWKLKATNTEQRGQAQMAYHILVAGSEELLAQNKGDLWDSGEIKSDQSNLVIYRGSPLPSGMLCYWKVRVRDNNGILSAWSKSAKWTMGLLNPSD